MSSNINRSHPYAADDPLPFFGPDGTALDGTAPHRTGRYGVFQHGRGTVGVHGRDAERSWLRAGLTDALPVVVITLVR